MPNYKPYHPEQAELLPAHVRDVLGKNHLCFLVHEVVEKLDLGGFEAAYGEAAGESPYHPRLMVKVWLYAFALQVKSTRAGVAHPGRPGFRFLAGSSAPDHKTLSEFLRRHRAHCGVVRSASADAAACRAGAAGRSGHRFDPH